MVFNSAIFLFSFLPIFILGNLLIQAHAKYYEKYHVDNNDTILILGDSYFHDYGVISDLAEGFHTTLMFNGTDSRKLGLQITSLKIDQ